MKVEIVCYFFILPGVTSIPVPDSQHFFFEFAAATTQSIEPADFTVRELSLPGNDIKFIKRAKALF